MSEDQSRMQGHLRALSAVNRHLAAQTFSGASHPRSGIGVEWLADLSEHEQGRSNPPFLVRHRSGMVYLIEQGRRRPIRSGMLAVALEVRFGEIIDVSTEDLERWTDGPPVEVFEAPRAQPFIIVGHRRIPIEGLPLTYPVPVDAMLPFSEAPALDVGHLLKGQSKAKVHLPPLPNFLIIGAQKSATRWLRGNLDAHPDVHCAPGEPSFFNDEDRFKKDGFDGYRTNFEGWTGQPHVGESTPGYLMWIHEPERVAKRIDEGLPGVQLIALLRDPVERANSAMVHHIRRGRLPETTTLMSYVTSSTPEADRLGLITGGWYARSLAPYIERFGDRLLILLHEEVSAEPSAVYRTTLDHLGVERYVVPEGVDRIRFSNQTGSLAQGVSIADRHALYEYFADDVCQLEEMLDRDLTLWRPVELPSDELGV